MSVQQRSKIRRSVQQLPPVPEIDWTEAEMAASVLRDAAVDLDKRLGVGSPGRADIAELARTYIAVCAAAQHLLDARDEIHDWIAQAMEDNEQHVPGVGDLTREWRKESRKDWKSDDVRRDALHVLKGRVPPHAIDPETGEMVHTWDQAVDALSALYNLAGYNARIATIKRLGLSVDDYCREGPWVPRVSIVPERTDEGADDE